MAGDEYKAQQVVADVVIHGCSKVRYLHLPLGDLTTEMFVLAVDERSAAKKINRSMFRRGHEPRARILRNARLGPLFKRGNEGILRQLFCDAHVAHHSSQPGNYPSRLDSPNRLNRAMRIGSCHSYRSHHVHAFSATSAWSAAFAQGESTPGSKSWRNSHSPSPATWRNFRASSIASPLEFTLRIANPPTISFASVKGPSVTVNLPLDRRTRAPTAVGRQPSVASNQPAFIPSSISLPIVAISCWV